MNQSGSHIESDADRLRNDRLHNPADDYPPTRPTLTILGAALAVVLAVVILSSWPTISHAIHLKTIEAALGL